MGICRCRKCNKQIVFVRTRNGKSIPCDPSFTYYKQDPKGKDRIVNTRGDVIRCTILPDEEGNEGWGYKPHWGTCTDPDAFRRKKQ